MKPREILAWADRLSQRERELVILHEQLGEIRLKVGRLSLFDSFLIDQTEGRNPLLELLDVPGQQARIYKPFSFSLQARIFYHGLKKCHPEFSYEDALAVFSLLPPVDRLKAVTWILAGVTDEERPLEFTKGGHPAFRVDFWLPLLSHLFHYSIDELLNMNLSQLALLITGVQAVAAFYAMLFGGKKSKAKLADPLVFVYPEVGGKDDKGRKDKERDRADSVGQEGL